MGKSTISMAIFHCPRPRPRRRLPAMNRSPKCQCPECLKWKAPCEVPGLSGRGKSGHHWIRALDDCASYEYHMNIICFHKLVNLHDWMLLMLTYVDICWHMLTYVDICWHMLTYVDICWHLLTYVDILKTSVSNMQCVHLSLGLNFLLCRWERNTSWFLRDLYRLGDAWFSSDIHMYIDVYSVSICLHVSTKLLLLNIIV